MAEPRGCRWFRTETIAGGFGRSRSWTGLLRIRFHLFQIVDPSKQTINFSQRFRKLSHGSTLGLVSSFRGSASKGPSSFPFIQFEARHDIWGAGQGWRESSATGRYHHEANLASRPEGLSEKLKEKLWECGLLCRKASFVGGARGSPGHSQDIARTSPGLVQSGHPSSGMSGLYEAETCFCQKCKAIGSHR